MLANETLPTRVTSQTIDNREQKITGKRQISSKENKNQPPAKRVKNEEVQYHVEDNLRFVVPYKFSFISNAKKRWWGENLLETYTKEFAAYPAEYYVGFLNIFFILFQQYSYCVGRKGR